MRLFREDLKRIHLIGSLIESSAVIYGGSSRKQQILQCETGQLSFSK